MIKKRILALMLGMIMLFAEVLPVCATDDAPKLYIDNTLIELKNPCVIENSTVYVPLIETFFKLGVYMEWNDELGCYYGQGNNGEIRVKMDEMTVDIDWVDVELPAPTKEINGVAMVPLYIVEDAVKTETPVYDEATNSIYIKFPDITDEPYKKFSIESIEHSLPAGDELFKEEWLYNMDPATNSDYIVYKTVDVEGMPFNKAASLETLALPGNSVPTSIYSIQLHKVVDTGDFLSGEVGLMTFWARATKITDESGKARFRLTYEIMGGAWNKAQNLTVSVGTEWKKYYLPIYSGNYNLYSGGSHICFAVGAKPQTIEIADVHMRNFHNEVDYSTLNPAGGSDYKGIEENALWRKEAYRRIEKYRKNDMVVRVMDENGNPVPNAEIKADLTDNEFMYGLSLTYLEYVNLNVDDSTIARTRDYVLKNLTNTALDGGELKETTSDFRKSIQYVNALYEYGKRQRGHCLTWNAVKIRQMEKYPDVTYEEMYDYLMRYITEEIWLFKGVMTQWDVLNEPVDSADMRVTYGTQMFSDAFKLAKALDPKAKLYVNETGMEGHQSRDENMRADSLLRIITPMRENERAPIDGIGVQGHCVNYYYPQGFYQELCRLQDFADELAVTEYDFYNDDMSSMGNHLFDTFLATYSHPKTTAFIIWGYMDKMHWRRCGTFFDRDWIAKPGYYVWQDIVNNFLAEHLTAVTDENGVAVLRGQRGDYKISVSVNGVESETEFTLTNSENAERDNYINAMVNGNKIEWNVANSPEVKSNGPVTFRSGDEAYADYLSYTRGRTLIGIYKHTDSEGSTVPKTTDGLMNTYWYGNGDGAYVQYELVEPALRGDVTVDFRAVNGEVYNYRILKSSDGETWEEIWNGSSADASTVNFTDAMFIRIQSVGNEYMGISEVTINAEK